MRFRNGVGRAAAAALLKPHYCCERAIISTVFRLPPPLLQLRSGLAFVATDTT